MSLPLSCLRSPSCPAMSAMRPLFTLLITNLPLARVTRSITAPNPWSTLLCGRCSVKDSCWEWSWCGMGTRLGTDAPRLWTPAPRDPYSSRLWTHHIPVGAPGQCPLCDSIRDPMRKCRHCAQPEGTHVTDTSGSNIIKISIPCLSYPTFLNLYPKTLKTIIGHKQKDVCLRMFTEVLHAIDKFKLPFRQNL